MNFTAESDVIDPNISDDPLASDPELRRELAGMFLEDCPRLMSEIRAAVTEHDGSSLDFAAHTLKGSVGVFKVQRAFDVACRMEQVGKECDWEHAEATWTALKGEMTSVVAMLSDLANSVHS